MDVYKKVMSELYLYLCVMFYLGIVEKYCLFFKIFLEEEIIIYLFM